MVDPLSVAASVAGIIGLADVTFRYVFRYTRAAAGAKEEIKALATEIHDLGGVLRNLDALCRYLETDGQDFSPNLRLHCLGQLQGTLDKIDKRLKRSTESFDKRSKLKEIYEQMKWPFSASETKDLLAKISRYKETLTLAASADTVRELQVCLSRQIEHGKKLDTLNQKIDEIQAKAEIPTNIILDEQKKRILNFFLGPEINPQANLDQSIKLRYPTTRRWLFTDDLYQDWLQNPGSKLWLSGLAGGGKTILAGAVIQDAISMSTDDIGVAFFFCDYKKEATLTPVNILGGILSQLARQRDDFFAIARDYYEELHPSRALDKLPDVDELRARISQISEELKQLIIVIDGIDECGDGTTEALDILVELTESTDNISMALFSRDEDIIQEHLGAFEQISIEAHTEDLQDYVRAELEERVLSGRLRLKNMELKEEIGEELVNRANGMFRWVVCQLDYLSEFATDDDRREALRELPPTLRDSYIRLLKRVNTRPPKVQKMVQLCLHFIAFFPDPLSVQELCQAVSVPAVVDVQLRESQIVTERDIARECSSLLRISADSRSFEFAHFTVQEFLQDSKLCEIPHLGVYQLARENSQQIMATECVKFVQLKNFQSEPTSVDEWYRLKVERQDSFPFYAKAATAWIRFTREGFKEDALLDAVKTLFHPFRATYLVPWMLDFLFGVAEMIERDSATPGPLLNGWPLSNGFTSNHNIHFIHFEVLIDEIIDGSWKPLHIAAALNLPEAISEIISLEGRKTLNVNNPMPLEWAEMTIFKDLQDASGKTTRLFLPTPRRRIDAISYLIDAGPKLSELGNRQRFEFNFMAVFLTDWQLASFTPSIQLLQADVIPVADSIAPCINQLKKIGYLLEEHELEVGLLEILRYLKESSSYDTDCGFELGKVLWSVALDMKMPLTKSPELTDSRISVSDSSFQNTLLAAIRLDRVEELEVLLKDDRVSLANNWSGGTLLHTAVSSSAICCARFLLEKGSSPSQLDDKGDPPFFHHAFLDNMDMLKLFVEYDADIFIQGSDEYTIWHYCVVSESNEPAFLDFIFDLDKERTSSSLLIECENGSPLNLSLRQHGSDYELDEWEDRAIQLLEYCNRVPHFWENHPCIFPIAVQNTCKKMLRRLLELNIGPKPTDSNGPTLLHYISLDADGELVEILKSICPEAASSKFNCYTPVERYLIECFHRSDRLDLVPVKKVVSALAHNSTDLSSCQLDSSLWTFACYRFHMLIQDFINGEYAYRDVGTLVFEVLLDLGAMHSYEVSSGLSGAEVFFNSITDCKIGRNRHGLLDLSGFVSFRTIEKIILGSDKWNPLSKSAAILTQQAVGAMDLAIVKGLLDNGVDVHQTDNGLTILEFACDQASSLCRDEKGRDIIKPITLSF